MTRSTLDRALSGTGFVVDALSCAASARVVRSFGAEVSTKRAGLHEAQESLFRLMTTAICHAINWDFLSSRVLVGLRSIDFDISALSVITARQIQIWLEGYSRPERIKSKERASIVRETASILIQRFNADAGEVFSRSDHSIFGPTGLMYQLSFFPAFAEDPLRKKANVLIHDVIRDDFYGFCDSAKVEPAIDYHIMRLYLRTGRVVALHPETMKALQADISPRARLVTLLRRSVSDALSSTALYAGTSIPVMNGIEWQIGRDICERSQPKCDTGHFNLLSLSSDHQSVGCPYRETCRAYHDAEWKALREPDLKSRFY